MRICRLRSSGLWNSCVCSGKSCLTRQRFMQTRLQKGMMAAWLLPPTSGTGSMNIRWTNYLKTTVVKTYRKPNFIPGSFVTLEAVHIFLSGKQCPTGCYGQWSICCSGTLLLFAKYNFFLSKPGENLAWSFFVGEV